MDTISLRIASPAALPASVTQSLEFAVSRSDTVLDVKLQIVARLRGVLPPDELADDVRGDSVMRIIFQGRFLRDETVLGDIVQTDEVTFHMMLKPSLADALASIQQSQPVEAVPRREPARGPAGTNLVIYQDPAAPPLLSPHTTFPVRTASGRLGLLVSPQGVAEFANAGIAIVPQASAPAVTPAAPGSLVARARAALANARNNAQRLRTTLALTWLFLRLVFFVGILSGELGTARFWTISAFAVLVFVYRANLVSGVAAALARRLNNLNINVLWRPDDDDDNVVPRYRVLYELERVVVVFVGTLVPAVYDAWHRHELARAEARDRRQREREAELNEQRARAEGPGNEPGNEQENEQAQVREVDVDMMMEDHRHR